MTFLSQHIYRTGPKEKTGVDPSELDDATTLRRHIEPWLTAVFQSEHLSLLLGNGFTSAVVTECGGASVNMGVGDWRLPGKEKIIDYAKEDAKRCDGALSRDVRKGNGHLSLVR